MKLLFDANLAPRLVTLMGGNFIGSLHVRRVGPLGMPDEQIWEFARQNKFVIVSKDNDFFHMSMVRSWPPKVVFLRVGNMSTARIAELLVNNIETIVNFGEDLKMALLVLSNGA